MNVIKPTRLEMRKPVRMIDYRREECRPKRNGYRETNQQAAQELRHERLPSVPRSNFEMKLSS